MLPLPWGEVFQQALTYTSIWKIVRGINSSLPRRGVLGLS